MFKSLKNLFVRRRQRREMTKKGFLSARKRRTSEKTLGQAMEKSKSFLFVVLLVIWVVSVLVMILPLHKPSPLALVPNQQAPATVYADFDFSYENTSLTKLNRERVRRQEPLVYRLDEDVCRKTMDIARELFKQLKTDKNPTEETRSENGKKSESIISDLSSEARDALLVIEQIPGKKEMLLNELETRLYYGIFQSGEREARQGNRIRIYKGKIREKAKSFSTIPSPFDAAGEIAETVSRDLSPHNRRVIGHTLELLLSEIIKGNLVYDEDETAANRIAAANQIDPVIIDVTKGDTIISRGRVLEKDAIERYQNYLKELRFREGLSQFWRKLTNSALLCLLLMILTGIYLHHIHPEVVRSSQKMGVVGTVVVLTMLANYLTIGGFHALTGLFINLNPTMISAVLPIAMASMLLSVLIGLRVALYAGLFVSLIAALQLDSSFHVVLSGMVSSCIAGFAVRHVPNHRAYYLRGALAIMLTVPLMELLYLWSNEGNVDAILWIIGLGAANGILTAGLALIMLFILETVFQISTDMSLLLLCDYNHPLLKRLQFEAPGTYHHSLMVSTLAEQAAQTIGANPIRARVGALFHDIGKLAKPEYFIENSQEKNKHDQLNPRMSSLIILNHVKEGTDMAIKYKLRRIIRDAIEQHHGTDLIYYFFNRAQQSSDSNKSVDESDYRYPGPAPREKEVVLISLADACEAASRSLEKPTPQKIDALVWEIFRKRIRTGQLDDAELTIGELAKVRESFVKTISTMMHGRISYPKEEDEDDDQDDLFMAAKNISGSSTEAASKSD